MCAEQDKMKKGVKYLNRIAIYLYIAFKKEWQLFKTSQ